MLSHRRVFNTLDMHEVGNNYSAEQRLSELREDFVDEYHRSPTAVGRRLPGFIDGIKLIGK
jgi:hypothetical protein